MLDYGIIHYIGLYPAHLSYTYVVGVWVYIGRFRYSGGSLAINL